MGVIDKAGELVSTAAGRVSARLSDLPELPGVDIERLRIVIEVVWENRDLLVKLPSVLGDAGEQMQAAGAGAREVGHFMSGEVHELTSQAADTLEACRKPLAQVGEVLDELGAILDRLPLVGNVAEPATRGLGAISEVATNIERVSVQLRGLSVSMQGAGAGLDAMGASLQGGGVALATVSGRTIAQAAAARRRIDEVDVAGDAAPATDQNADHHPPPEPPVDEPPTTKKSTTKKPTNEKSPATKKPASKKSSSTTKKPASKKSSSKRSTKGKATSGRSKAKPSSDVADAPGRHT